MHRQRYIRFFISSTFADMAVERNLLQEVMNELSYEYSLKNWQIESIDLRWGITKEAGWDNRTIHICIEELRRCREISPKPNFILLLGERYGWIPLPEILSVDEVKRIEEVASHDEYSLFNKWYMLDSNQLPNPLYVLQPRYGKYLEESVWESDVYNPLRSMFDALSDYKYLMSATEIEIQNGALQIDNANEHVIGYFRTLSGIPPEKDKIYRDDNSDSLNLLKDKLIEKLSPANIYSESVSYSEYKSEAFKDCFKNNMRSHLISVINQAIYDYGESDDENSVHIDIAEDESRFFVGREKELSEIDKYINDSGANHAIWYRSRSGTGKSALISQVVQKYKTSHNVVIRFCGTTKNSSNGHNLLEDINKQICNLYQIVADEVRNDSDNHGGHLSRIRKKSLSSKFISNLKFIKDEAKPLIIIIDGMNQLSEDGSEEFMRMRWADVPLKSNVRIILTSTDDYRMDYNPHTIDIIQLRPLHYNDVIAVIQGIMELNGRTLSQSQFKYIRELVANSDQRPVYLTLLANLLSKYHSYDILPEIPYDFKDLVRMILNQISSVHNHDTFLVKLSLSLFAAERRGLSQTELMSIMSSDDLFVNHIRNSSFHEFKIDENNPKIPPVLWSRLYTDISFFFKTRHGKWGDLLYIYHGEFIDAIKHIYMDTLSGFVKPYISLADFYKNFETAHALSEAFHTRYIASDIIFNSTGKESYHAGELKRLLMNPHYMHRKINLDKNDLIGEFGKLLNVMRRSNTDGTREIFQMRNDIANISVSDWDLFLAQCMNLHPHSPLRALIDEQFKDFNSLRDILAGNGEYDMVTNVSTKPGAKPILSDDGSRLLSMFKNGHVVQVEDMNDSKQNRRYSLKSSIMAIDASSDLRIHAILLNNGLIIYDSFDNKVLHKDGSVTNGVWTSISADGSVYAYGGKNGCGSNVFELNEFVAISGKLSPSGRFLWVASNKVLKRFDSNTRSTFNMDFNNNYDGESDAKIIAADDHTCILHNNKLLFYAYVIPDSAESKYYSWRANEVYDTENIIGAVSDGRLLSIRDSNFGVCEVLSVRNNRLEVDYTTNMYSIAVLSRNMKFAYSVFTQQTYDLSILLKTYSAVTEFNQGINTIASDYAGNCLVVTKGMNHMFETSREILLAENGRAMRKLNFWGCDTNFFSTCAVSPKGDRIWLSEYQKDQHLLLTDRTGRILTKIQDAGSDISINYTDDSTCVVALRGHHFASYDPMIHIMDCAGVLLRKFVPKGSEACVASKWHAQLSHCNRYLISDDGDIIDLVEERLVFSECEHKPRFADVMKISNRINQYPLFAVHPFWGIIRERMYIIFYNGKLMQSDYDKKVISCTHSGRYLFALDENRSLFMISILSNDDCFLAQDVNEVYPLYNERYLFIIQKDGTILFYDIRDKKILQKAFFPNCDLFCVNARGLAAVSPGGKLCLFEPDKRYNYCSDMSVTVSFRWNLSNKKQSDVPTAVCPVCGHVFVPSDDVLNHISTHEVLSHEDWDYDILSGECPACRVSLKFNPIFAGII